MGLVGFELIGIAISRRIYRSAACVQRGGGGLDAMAVSRKFGDLAVNLGAARNSGAYLNPGEWPLHPSVRPGRCCSSALPRSASLATESARRLGAVVQAA
jgi:hypothetical protein